MKVKNALGNEYSGTIGKKETAVMRDGCNFLRKYTVPYDPKTEAQLQQRNKFSDAHKAWRELPSETKAQLDKLAEGTGLSGYNLFVRQFATRRN